MSTVVDSRYQGAWQASPPGGSLSRWPAVSTHWVLLLGGTFSNFPSFYWAKTVTGPTLGEGLYGMGTRRPEGSCMPGNVLETENTSETKQHPCPLWFHSLWGTVTWKVIPDKCVLWDISFLNFYVGGCAGCMYAHVPCACLVATDVRSFIIAFGTRVTGGREPSCGCWK